MDEALECLHKAVGSDAPLSALVATSCTSPARSDGPEEVDMVVSPLQAKLCLAKMCRADVESHCSALLRLFLMSSSLYVAAPVRATGRPRKQRDERSTGWCEIPLTSRQERYVFLLLLSGRKRGNDDPGEGCRPRAIRWQ